MQYLKRVAPLVKIHGGKYYLAKKLIPLFDASECSKFVDCTVGGGSIVLNAHAPEIKYTLAADINPQLIMCYNFVKIHYSEIEACLKRLKPSEDGSCWENCNEIWKRADFEHPRWHAAYIYKYRASRAGLGKEAGWSPRLRGGQPEYINSWENFVESQFPLIYYRSKNIVFECNDIVSTIQLNSSRKTLFYIDPPYVHESRTQPSVYEFEMPTFKKDFISRELSHTSHEEMIETIFKSRGLFYISGYKSELYDLRMGPPYMTFDMPNHSGQQKIKQSRVECLWRIDRRK